MSHASPSLLFREFLRTDLPVVAQAMGDERVTQFYGLETTHPNAHAVAREQLDWYRDLARDKTGWWQAITVQRNVVGGIGVYDRDDDGDSAELGYWLLPCHWGQGIMRTALPLWLPGAFKRLALHSVVAHVEPENTASTQLLAKAGFTHEGLLRDCSKRGSRYVSLQRYSLLVDELPPL